MKRIHSSERKMKSLQYAGDMDLAGLDPEDRQAWRNQIDRSLHACGCSEGTAGMLFAAAATIIAIAADAFWLPDAWWQLGLLVLASAVAGAVVGKIFGKARGRYRAHRLMAQLAERLA
jgi:hypothetical protein